MKFKKNKKAQLKMSFGMIFSIILIVIFIAFAIFGVKKFLGIQDSISSKQFIENLQNDVDRMWESSQGSQEIDYVVSKKIEGFCITDDSYANYYFLPESFGEGNLKNVDIDKSLGSKEKLCFPNENGRITINLEKDFGENLVTMTR